MIKGEITSLTTVNFRHLEELRTRRNDVAIRQWCRQHSLIEEKDQVKWHDAINTDSSIKMFAITLPCDYTTSEGMLVGVCGLTDINLIHRRAEFSLYIFPEYQRKGLAFDALKTLFRHGFNDWHLHLIWGETFEGNPALDLFINKMGMEYEGTRRDFYFKNGSYVDANLVSITRKDFDARFMV